MGLFDWLFGKKEIDKDKKTTQDVATDLIFCK